MNPERLIVSLLAAIVVYWGIVRLIDWWALRGTRRTLAAIIERREAYLLAGCPAAERDPFGEDIDNEAWVQLARFPDLLRRDLAVMRAHRDAMNARGIIVLTAGRKPWE